MARQGLKLLYDLSRRYNIREEDVCFAILAARGIDMGIAFKVVYNTSAKDYDKAAKRLLSGNPQIEMLIKAEKELRNGQLPIGYIKESKMERESRSAMLDKSVDLRSKSGVLDALEEAYRSADNAKMQADILSKIADLQKMKNEEDQEQKKLVNYYLPLRCEVCPYLHGSTE